jgi:hypothetical protein
MHRFWPILRMLTKGGLVIAGCSAFYAAFFMYEDEEGRWQNRIDNLWISIDDRARQIGSRPAALFSKVAEAVTTCLDRVFGRKLFSMRMIGSSTSYSYFVLSAITLIARSPGPGDYYGGLSDRVFVVTVFLVSSCAAILPTVFQGRWLTLVSLLPLVMCAIAFWADITVKMRNNLLPEFPIVLGVAMTFGVISDVLVNVIVRSTIRRVAGASSLRTMIGALFIQFSSAILISLGPLVVSTILQHKRIVPIKSLITTCINIASAFNVVTALFCFVFVFALSLVLAHRIFWPLTARLIYPFARYQIVQSRRALAAVGAACCTIGFGIGPNVVKVIIDILAK